MIDVNFRTQLGNDYNQRRRTPEWKLPETALGEYSMVIRAFAYFAKVI